MKKIKHVLPNTERQQQIRRDLKFRKGCDAPVAAGCDTEAPQLGKETESGIRMHPISPCMYIQVVYSDAGLSEKKMEETVHGSYSWCRLTKRKKN